MLKSITTSEKNRRAYIDPDKVSFISDAINAQTGQMHIGISTVVVDGQTMIVLASPDDLARQLGIDVPEAITKRNGPVILG